MRSCSVTKGTQPGVPLQPGGVGWGGGWEGDSRGKRHVYLWLIHVVVQQKPTEHCKATILQLKVNSKNTGYVPANN